MDVLSSSSPLSLPPNGSPDCTSTVPPDDDSNPTVENHIPSPRPLINGKKRKKTIDKDAPSSSSSSIQRGNRVLLKRRTPRVRFGPVRRYEGREVESIGLPLGMSFAAVVAQVRSSFNLFLFFPFLSFLTLTWMKNW